MHRKFGLTQKMTKKVRRVGPDKGGKWEVIDQ